MVVNGRIPEQERKRGTFSMLSVFLSVLDMNSFCISKYLLSSLSQNLNSYMALTVYKT